MGGGWAAFRGPAGACVMSLLRAQWSWPAWDVFHTRDQLVARLAEVCPVDVQATFNENSECELWARRTREPDLAQVAPRPPLAPAVAKLRRRPTEESGTHVANAARQAVTHGPWTQDELHKIGKACTAHCHARRAGWRRARRTTTTIGAARR